MMSAEYYEDMPDLDELRDRAARDLGLDLPGEAEVIERVREVALGAGEEYVLLNAEEGCAYRPLIEA
jgi:hypothetical protein